MIRQILAHTPPWVFVLFVVLFVVGWLQTRPRRVAPTMALMLPAAMVALSLLSVLSAFASSTPALLAWLLGLVVSSVVGFGVGAPRGVRPAEDSRRVFVPGSYVPLAAMMAIFFFRYAVAVTVARQMPVAATEGFALAVPAAYGALSGVFVARAAVIHRVAMRSRAAAASA